MLVHFSLYCTIYKKGEPEDVTRADTSTGDCVPINRELGMTAAYLLVTFVNKHPINYINGSI